MPSLGGVEGDIHRCHTSVLRALNPGALAGEGFHVAIIHVVTTHNAACKANPSPLQCAARPGGIALPPRARRRPVATRDASRASGTPRYFSNAFPLAMLLIIALALAPRCAHGADGRHGPPVIFEGDTEDAGAAST